MVAATAAANPSKSVVSATESGICCKGRAPGGASRRHRRNADAHRRFYLAEGLGWEASFLRYREVGRLPPLAIRELRRKVDAASMWPAGSARTEEVLAPGLTFARRARAEG